MALAARKPRPLARDPLSLRDDRLFIVACDDTYAPKQYFDFFRLTRVQVHVVQTEDGSSSAQHVLNRLLEFEAEEGDERWLLLDTDHYTSATHIKSLKRALNRARHHGVNVAFSKPAFELWLLLHHVADDHPEIDGLNDASATLELLRRTLGSYSKTRLRPADYPIDSVAEACFRAERRDDQNLLPTRTTSRVYRLWKAIVAKALPSQLPKEIHALVPAVQSPLIRGMAPEG